MATQDQVLWGSVNVNAGGESQSFPRGALLPEPVTAEEVAERSLLRIGGAIRVVEVVYTPEELADMARAQAEAGAAREAALQVDTSLPIGEQVPGTVEPGPPTLTGSVGAPVVVGSREDKASRDDKASAAKDDKTATAAKDDDKPGKDDKPPATGTGTGTAGKPPGGK